MNFKTLKEIERDIGKVYASNEHSSQVSQLFSKTIEISIFHGFQKKAVIAGLNVDLCVKKRQK